MLWRCYRNTLEMFGSMHLNLVISCYRNGWLEQSRNERGGFLALTLVPSVVGGGWRHAWWRCLRLCFFVLQCLLGMVSLGMLIYMCHDTPICHDRPDSRKRISDLILPVPPTALIIEYLFNLLRTP